MNLLVVGCESKCCSFSVTSWALLIGYCGLQWELYRSTVCELSNVVVDVILNSNTQICIYYTSTKLQSHTKVQNTVAYSRSRDAEGDDLDKILTNEALH